VWADARISAESLQGLHPFATLETCPDMGRTWMISYMKRFPPALVKMYCRCPERGKCRRPMRYTLYIFYNTNPYIIKAVLFGQIGDLWKFSLSSCVVNYLDSSISGIWGGFGLAPFAAWHVTKNSLYSSSLLRG